MPLPDDYLPAVEALGRVFATYAHAKGHSPVLVGGAAAALFTDGAFLSGDFDIVAASDNAFDEAMRAHGFRREDRHGKLHVGWYHPGHPRYGFQQVSTRLYDGRGEAERSIRVVMASDSAVVLTAVEDLIADRLGQYAVAAAIDRGSNRPAPCSRWPTASISTIFAGGSPKRMAISAC